jgi:hypothetical protein
MDIREVEEILSSFPVLRKPTHILFIQEPVYKNHTYVYRGATFLGSDVIALTPHANDETVVHEFLHTLGIGEFGAYKLAPILNKIRKFRILKIPVHYEECKGCEVKEAHRGNVKHYVRV